MKTTALKALLVEDNPGDARLFMEMLREAGAMFATPVHASTLEDAVRHMRGSVFDVIILDLSLPDSHGIETLRRVREAAGTSPIVVLTGNDDQDLGIKAVHDGAQDYLAKGEVTPQWLARSANYAIERKRAEWIEQERRSLATAVRGMDQLLAAVAHDLRIPLASLRMTSELLMDESSVDDSERQKFLTAIHNEVLRMSRMVDDILESARLESASAKWQWTTVSVRQVCHDAIEVVTPWVQEKPIEIGWQCLDPEYTFRGDADAIRRLLVNLLSNAIKHTSRGRIDIHCAVEEHQGEQWIRFEVRDTGAGISDEVAAKLGKAFALNDGVVDSMAVKGAGLGLAICTGIAAAHGGRISFSTTRHEGSTFIARLRADLEEPAKIAEELEVLREVAA